MLVYRCMSGSAIPRTTCMPICMRQRGHFHSQESRQRGTFTLSGQREFTQRGTSRQREFMRRGTSRQREFHSASFTARVARSASFTARVHAARHFHSFLAVRASQRELHAARVSRIASSRSAGTVARERVARIARPHHSSTVTATAATRNVRPRRRRRRGSTWACRRRAGLPDTDGAAVDGALLSMACCRWPAVDGACCRRRVGDDLARGAWRGACRLFGCRGPKKRRRAADTCGPPGCWYHVSPLSTAPHASNDFQHKL